jgi:transposase
MGRRGHGLERGGRAPAARARTGRGGEGLGKKIEWQSLMPPRGYVALPKRWVVERTFSWLSQNRRMSSHDISSLLGGPAEPP